MSLGDGTTDVLLRAVYQFEHGSFYFSQQVGYDLRGGDAPDGIPLYTEAGYNLGAVHPQRLLPPLPRPGRHRHRRSGLHLPQQQGRDRAGGRQGLRPGHGDFGVFVAGFATLDGRNSGDATGFSFGTTFGF